MDTNLFYYFDAFLVHLLKVYQVFGAAAGEALNQMPLYAKFMKELLTGRKRPKDDENIALSGNCSAILQRKLPPKLKDPGAFTIPCSIGPVEVGKALCDLGSS